MGTAAVTGAGARAWVATGVAALAAVHAAPVTPAGAQENTVGAEGPSTLVHPPFRHTYGIHKARTPHLKLFLAGRTVFADPQGLAAVKLAEDDDPDVRGDDFQLTVFGLNAGRGEIIFNSSMQTLAMYGTHGSREGQFDGPRGIGADVNGNVYVADTGNQRVVRLAFDAQDRQVRWKGLLPGSYREPWGVAVAPPGHEVYVSDRAANQVYRWRPPQERAAGSDGLAAPDGSRQGAGGDSPRADLPARMSDPAGGALAPTGGGSDPTSRTSHQTDGAPEPVFPEGLARPTAIAVTDRDETWLSVREDALFVVYEDGARLAKFDLRGNKLAETVAAEREAIAAAPRFAYVAVDFYGNVYLTDTGNGTIYKFRPDLTFLTSYGTPGEGDQQLNEPRGIAIWKRFGQVFVAEKQGAQYFFVGTDVLLPGDSLAIRVTGTGPKRRYAFDAFTTEPAELSLVFLSEAGAPVDSIALPKPVGSGRVTIEWRGLDVEADLSERATRIVLEPRPTYSSRRRFSRRIERDIAWQVDP